MIKFTARTADGRTLICLGLSHANLERLKDNQPIRFKGDDIGMLLFDFMIFSGETEDSMAKELEPMITAETIIKSHT